MQEIYGTKGERRIYYIRYICFFIFANLRKGICIYVQSSREQIGLKISNCLNPIR